MTIIRDEQTKKLYVYDIDSCEVCEVEEISAPLDVVPESLVEAIQECRARKEAKIDFDDV